MRSCLMCGGSPAVVSSLSAYREKRSFAAMTCSAPGSNPNKAAHITGASMLPGDLKASGKVSRLPGDVFRTARDSAFKVFGSMREAFAAPVSA